MITMTMIRAPEYDYWSTKNTWTDGQTDIASLMVMKITYIIEFSDACLSNKNFTISSPLSKSILDFQKNSHKRALKV